MSEQTDPNLDCYRRDTPEGVSIVIPVVEEVAQVSTHQVETGRVRIVKTVREEEQVIDRPLLREHVDVQRVPVNEFVQQAPPLRVDGETLVIPIVEEVLVVEKRLMLKEELRVTRQRIVEPHEQRITLRTEEARIERLDESAINEDRNESATGPSGT